MATPFVSASAVILHQYFKEGWHPSGQKHAADRLVPSAPLLKALLLASAQPLTHDSAGSTPNARQGFGRLALNYATYFHGEIDGATTHLLLVNNETVAEDHRYDVCFRLPDPVPTASRVHAVRAVLVWMDPPPAERVASTMINDLDLTVVAPDGTLHKAQSEGGSSEAFDRQNNAELVTPGAAQPGVYRVTVFGHDVPEHAPYRDGLPFAIAVTAPGVQRVDCAAVASDLQCPTSCGHGTCDPATKQCSCPAPWRHVDCSECSGLTQCNGRGRCEQRGGQAHCTCDQHATGDRCDRCASGFAGQLCDGGCQQHPGCMSQGGTCDAQTGRCQCHNSDAQGHWAGTSCSECSEGWRGDPSQNHPAGNDQSCKTRSYWCQDHRVVEITGQLHGWLQINGGMQYRNSLSCRWRINVPHGKRMTLRFDRFASERHYDWLSVCGGRDCDVRNRRLMHESGRCTSCIPGSGTGYSHTFLAADFQPWAYVLFESDLYNEGGQEGVDLEFTIQ